jgi:hypothetical protein
MLSSTFKQDLCTLIVKKAKIHRKKIPQFQVALTVVHAIMMNPETQKDSREACTAFELQVPVSQRRAMEELFTKAFKGTTANDLNFIYYKQRHHHHDVFYMAVQAQRLHEESYRVVAVEGIQDIQHIFHFEPRLQQQFPEIESILPTLKSTAPNDHGLLIGRYNILCKKSKFLALAKKLEQEFTRLYLQYLRDENVEHPANHQAIRVTSRRPRARSHPWTVETPFSPTRHPSMKATKSTGIVALNFPQWLKPKPPCRSRVAQIPRL